MKINIKRLDDAFLMEATNEEGNTLMMDGSSDIGGEGKGMRPMQLLLAALGGCSAIDVILILKKQRQEINSLEVQVEGEREKIGDYSLYRDIVLHFIMSGNIEEAKVEKAVVLSLEKYCSVAKTLEPTARITHKITIHKNPD